MIEIIIIIIISSSPYHYLSETSVTILFIANIIFMNIENILTQAFNDDFYVFFMMMMMMVMLVMMMMVMMMVVVVLVVTLIYDPFFLHFQDLNAGRIFYTYDFFQCL